MTSTADRAGDRHDLYSQIQQTLTDRIVTVVGSGLSCATGLPPMSELAAHLKGTVPSMIRDDNDSSMRWTDIEANLRAGDDLETALGTDELPEKLALALVAQAAECVIAGEARVISRAVGDPSSLPFSRLLPHLLHANDAADVITTNYDRLIEVAIESSGYLLDTGFVGGQIGRFDSKAAAQMMYKVEQGPRGNWRRRARKHIRLHKPHGSLDWFQVGNEAMRLSVAPPEDAVRLMITPGVGKYRRGYDQPFDAHITSANKAIDDAGSLLFVGYGFRDDHLQTHLERRMRSGVPSLILAYQLTHPARRLLSESPATVALEAADSSGGAAVGTCVLTSDSELTVGDEQLWDLATLIQKVLT